MKKNINSQEILIELITKVNYRSIRFYDYEYCFFPTHNRVEQFIENYLKKYYNLK